VLLAEDDPDDQLLVREAWALQQLPYELCIVKDGQEAVDYLQHRGLYATQAAPRPRLILLDLNMPRKNGFETLAEVKADRALSRIPVVILTSSSETAFVEQTRRLGAQGYLVKPPSLQKLGEVLEAAVRFWLETAEPRPKVDEYELHEYLELWQ